MGTEPSLGKKLPKTWNIGNFHVPISNSNIEIGYSQYSGNGSIPILVKEKGTLMGTHPNLGRKAFPT